MPWNLIGNERAIRLLEQAGGSPQHAYLFSGPAGVGRATAARRLAQALNCTEENAPCLECKQCRRIEGGIHADVLTVTIEPGADGSSHKSISIEQLRDVEKMIALNPFEGRTRVVVIDPADGMLPPAQNMFLKTLEEPPAHVVLVLIASAPEKLLETIRSRCSRVEFGLVPTAEIEAALKVGGGDSQRARLLARLAGGRPGWALCAARDPRIIEQRAEAVREARSLPAMSTGDRMDLAERLTESFRRDRDVVFSRLMRWQEWWRDVLTLQGDAEQAVTNVDMLTELREDAAAYNGRDVARFAGALLDTRQWLSENMQTRMTLDALMLAAPRSIRR